MLRTRVLSHTATTILIWMVVVSLEATYTDSWTFLVQKPNLQLFDTFLHFLTVFCNFRRVFAEIIKKTAEKVQDFVKSCRKNEKVAEILRKLPICF